jgi:hypothetical protein
LAYLELKADIVGQGAINEDGKRLGLTGSLGREIE